MKNCTKQLVLLLVVIIAIGVVSVGTVCAVTPSAKNSKPVIRTATPTPVSPAKLKIKVDQAIKIALAAHKDSKIAYIELDKDVYAIRLQTANGKRVVRIDGNTGKILKDSPYTGTK